jgi:hypothetical protein
VANLREPHKVLRGGWCNRLLASGPPLEAKEADLSRSAKAPDLRNLVKARRCAVRSEP